MSRFVRCLVVASWLVAALAQADSLPLPASLIDVRSPQGQQLLLGSEALADYVPLSVNFVTQRTQTSCGVASSVVVLNALDVPAPTTPEYAPYHTFTQDNLLDERTEAVVPQAVVLKQGMTLDQLGRVLALHGVKVDVRHAGDGSLAAFRRSAQDHLGDPNRAVIVNFLRTAIGQQRGGHFSPLAAYDADSDRFLLLDVARYKYPPVWVQAAELFSAMNTPDSDNGDRTRGYLLIAKPLPAAARAD